LNSAMIDPWKSRPYLSSILSRSSRYLLTMSRNLILRQLNPSMIKKQVMLKRLMAAKSFQTRLLTSQKLKSQKMTSPQTSKLNQ